MVNRIILNAFCTLRKSSIQEFQAQSWSKTLSISGTWNSKRMLNLIEDVKTGSQMLRFLRLEGGSWVSFEEVESSASHLCSSSDQWTVVV